MTPEREAEIRNLAEAAERARMHYENSCMMNTPQDYEKRIAAMSDHAIVRARMVEAQEALRVAIESPPCATAISIL